MSPELGSRFRSTELHPAESPARGTEVVSHRDRSVRASLGPHCAVVMKSSGFCPLNAPIILSIPAAASVPSQIPSVSRGVVLPGGDPLYFTTVTLIHSYKHGTVLVKTTIIHGINRTEEEFDFN